MLRSSYLFQDLAPAELEPLAHRVITRHYDTGQCVYRAGERAHSLYVVATGQVSEIRRTAGGEQLVISTYTAGAVFGEPGLFAPGHTRMVDELATAPSAVLAIPRDTLLTVLHQHPPVMLRMLEGLAGELRILAERLASCAYLPIPDRLAARLLALLASHGQPGPHGTRIDLELSQSTLAAMIGASRENVNRALARFTAAGYLRLDGKTILITNAASLAHAAGTNPPPLPYRNSTPHQPSNADP